MVLADRAVYGNQAARAVPERNKAIPFSPVQGSTRHSLLDPPPRACSHVPGHATLMQLSPPKPRKLHVASPLWICQPLAAPRQREASWMLPYQAEGKSELTF